MTNIELPTRKNESFKYTSLKFLETTIFNGDLKSEVDFNLVSSLKLKEAFCIVVVDGVINKELSNSEVLKMIQTSLRKSNLESEDVISKLTQAYLHQEVSLKVPPNVKIEKPIQMIHIGSLKKNSTFFMKIDVGSGASIEILESFYSEADSVQLVKTQIACSQNSKVVHYRIQKRNEVSKFLGNTTAELASNCDYTSFTLNQGSGLGRDHNEIVFKGEESRGRIFCAFLAGTDQHLDQQSLVEHVKGHNTSLQQYRGIIGSNGKGVFNGVVRIHKDAQKANSEQSSKNLLLSEKAEINSKPHLEIFADDVKAAHGTTVGQLSPEEIFYLQSRGIPKKQSEQLLTEGFVLDILNEIENLHVKNLFTESIRKKLSPV